jgi:hypothetical protein
MDRYNYLHGFLSWHYLDEDIYTQLDTQFKSYKILFLKNGILNDSDKKNRFIKIINCKKTNLDNNIKQELNKCMGIYNPELNENLKTDGILSIFNRIYFIADFIKERIKLADNFLTKQNKVRIGRISRSRYKMNNSYYDTHENFKEQQIMLINEGCYDDFLRYKRVLRKWKLQNFKEIYQIKRT